MNKLFTIILLLLSVSCFSQTYDIRIVGKHTNPEGSDFGTIYLHIYTVENKSDGTQPPILRGSLYTVKIYSEGRLIKEVNSISECKHPEIIDIKDPAIEWNCIITDLTDAVYRMEITDDSPEQLDFKMTLE